MPSIFIWKSDSPNLSNDTIKIYHGSDWILEETDISISYKITDQTNIMYNDMNIIINTITNMPTDWVGNILLKSIAVPYICIKEDSYAKYEQIGVWNRVIIDSVVDSAVDSVVDYTIEFEKILKWIKNSKHIQHNKKEKHYTKQETLKQANTKQNVKINNDTCLINFNVEHITNIKLNTINNTNKLPTLKNISIPLRSYTMR
jgi:hypothetical protein